MNIKNVQPSVHSKIKWYINSNVNNMYTKFGDDRLMRKKDIQCYIMVIYASLLVGSPSFRQDAIR